MPNKKISDLTAGTPLSLDEIPAARSGANVKLLVGQIVDLAVDAVLLGSANVTVVLGSGAGQVADLLGAAVRSAVWELSVSSAAGGQTSRVVARSDGTDVYYGQTNILEVGNIAYPEVSVILVSGAMQLTVGTPAVGWTARFTRHTYL